MKIIHYLKVLAVIGFIIVEEIVWNRIGLPIYRTVESIDIMDVFRGWIEKVEHRYLLLLIFINPFVLMEVSSLFAVQQLTLGHISAGISLYMVKIFLTIPVVIIFNAGKKQLVTFWVIRYGYGCILNFKRSKTFRGTKRYIREIGLTLNEYKDRHFTGVSVMDGFKTIYNDLRVK